MTVQQPLKSALFVDFDNVYLGLQSVDAKAADLFATEPGSWLAALTGGDDGAAAHRFLVRNCYLNPSRFSKFRANWTRAGFRVIDCPSLTQQGKSSTDINLVLDAVDVLAGAVKVDEFFIASADADFTSLVHRIRAADRATTVIVAGAVASAYRNVADHVIETDNLLTMVKRAPKPAEASPVKPSHESPSRPQHSAVELQVTRVTDIPRLTTVQYAAVIEAIAAELASHPFARVESTKRVRDAIGVMAEPVGRAAINFIFSGLLYAGVPMQPSTSAEQIAEGWVNNVVALCQGARVEFDDAEWRELRAWVSGGVLI
jgi:hypothetical protein